MKLTVIAGIMLFCDGALACSCQEMPLSNHYASANAIVVARIKDVEISGNARFARYDLFQVMKIDKELPPKLPISSGGGADCQLADLVPGWSYLLVLDEEGRSSWCAGSDWYVKPGGETNETVLSILKAYQQLQQEAQ